MEQNRPAWPWIVATLLGLPVLYFLSFAPLIWLDHHDLLSQPLEDAFQLYAAPIEWTYEEGPIWWREFLKGYADFCRG